MDKEHTCRSTFWCSLNWHTWHSDLHFSPVFGKWQRYCLQCCKTEVKDKETGKWVEVQDL